MKIFRDVHWHLVTGMARLLFGLHARIRVEFLEPPPQTGGIILASNHISHFDPPLISISFPRKVEWIAMAELFKGRLMNAFFTGLNVIPVDRSGTDRTALRTAVKRLKEGRVVGIFPEGGIRDGAASIVNGAPMKKGVALLSGMSGAPILPCVILGSDRFYNKRSWRPGRRPYVWLAFGRPIAPPADLSGDALRSHMQDRLASEIAALRDHLIAKFGLVPLDLPQPPKDRMQEP